LACELFARVCFAAFGCSVLDTLPLFRFREMIVSLLGTIMLQ
jgi:hypothetical protein